MPNTMRGYCEQGAACRELEGHEINLVDGVPIVEHLVYFPTCLDGVVEVDIRTNEVVGAHLSVTDVDGEQDNADAVRAMGDELLAAAVWLEQHQPAPKVAEMVAIR